MKITPELFEEMKKLNTAYIGSDGREVNNPKPLAIPCHAKRPPTLQEQIQRVLRSELSRQAMDQGYETYEEADDFDVGPDFDNDPIDNSDYVVHDMIPEEPVERKPAPARKKGQEQADPKAASEKGVDSPEKTDPKPPEQAE